MKPYVKSHSEIDGNGFEYITVILEQPELDDILVENECLKYAEEYANK